MKINTGEKAKVEAALIAVNGTSCAFTVSSQREIVSIVMDAEKLLKEKGIPEKLWAGTKVLFVPSGPKSSACKCAIITTKITLLRGRRAWFLVDVERVYTYTKKDRLMTLVFNKAIRNRILTDALSVCVVQ